MATALSLVEVIVFVRKQPCDTRFESEADRYSYRGVKVIYHACTHFG